jgi:hypothetical protein
MRFVKFVFFLLIIIPSTTVACPVSVVLSWYSSFLYHTTKTGRHDIAEIVLKAALNTTQSINQSIKPKFAIVEFSASVI